MADLQMPSMVTEACAVRCITILMIECPNVTLFTMGKVTNKFVIRQDFVGRFFFVHTKVVLILIFVPASLKDWRGSYYNIIPCVRHWLNPRKGHNMQ